MVLEGFAVDNLTNGASFENLTIVAKQIASLTTLFQAIGGLIILYLIFNIINAVLNNRKNREIKEINKNLKEIKNLLSKKK